MNKNIHYQLEIRKYSAGELDKTRSEKLENHFRECVDCKSFYETLHRENEEFLNEHPFTSIFIPEKAPESESWFEKILSPLTRPVLIPVSIVLLLFAVVVPFWSIFYKDTHQDITYKGKPVLSFIYKRDGVVKEGSQEILFRSGDQLQIIYNSQKEQYVCLFSIDVNQNVSFYKPDPSSPLCSVPTGKGSSLYYPESIQLDNSPGAELIIAVFSPAPLMTSYIEKTMRSLFERGKDLQSLRSIIDTGTVLNRCSTASLLINKEKQ
jgi:hypothetical protein